MMLQFFVGLICGGAIGVLAMAVIIGARDDS